MEMNMKTTADKTLPRTQNSHKQKVYKKSKFPKTE